MVRRINNKRVNEPRESTADKTDPAGSSEQDANYFVAFERSAKTSSADLLTLLLK
jgi:hypothetical protein